jgi:peptide deformylase
MATRKVIKQGDPLLRKVAREVTAFDERLAELLDDMWDTMYKEDGVGLAAPQVAVLRRAAVVDTEDGNKVELVNPQIVFAEGEQIGFEGCLSVPDFNCKVMRPQRIKVTAQDRHGNPFEFTAEDFFRRRMLSRN